MTKISVAALDEDFARVTGNTTARITIALVAFLAADVASAIVTLFLL